MYIFIHKFARNTEFGCKGTKKFANVKIFFYLCTIFYKNYIQALKNQ